MSSMRAGVSGGALLAMLALLVGVFLAPPAAAYYEPGPAENISGTASNGKLVVNWSPPVFSGGTSISIIRYEVKISPPPSGGLYASNTCSTYTTTTCTFSNLSNGVDYYIEIRAYNNYGVYSWASAGPFRPCCSAPTPPTGVTAAADDGTVSVSWAPPANAKEAVGPFTYTVTSSPAGLGCKVAVTTCTFTGVANGTSYTLYVTASTPSGTSAGAGSQPVTPMGLPGPPTGVVGYVGERGSVEVTWQGPANTGGGEVTEYVATASPGGATCSAAGTLSCVVSGLSNGQAYTFTVVARNPKGVGPASESSPVARPLAGPGRPSAVKVVVSRGSAVVSWKPPRSTGGLKVVRYRVSSSPSGASCIVRGTTCRVSGLRDGTTYVFSIQAQNAKGWGQPAASSAVRTPAPPAAPVPQAPAPEPEKPTQVAN